MRAVLVCGKSKSHMFSLQRLLGKEDKFFSLLEASAEEARNSVRALVRLSKDLGTNELEAFAFARRKDKAITKEITDAVFTTFVTPLWINYLEAPPWLAVPLLAVAALAVIGVLIRRAAWGWAFFASSILVVAVVFTGVIGLFPNLIPSSLDPRYSLTLYNASSSPYTLRIMTFVAAVFVPLIIAYQIWVYRVFKGTVNTGDVARGKDAY